MPRFIRVLGTILIICVSLNAWADETDDDTNDDINEHLNKQAVPQVTSERLGNQSIEEFRVSNRLRTMKIDPDDGPAYYLKDKIGDGRLDDSHDSMEDDVNLRKWRLGQW